MSPSGVVISRLVKPLPGPGGTALNQIRADEQIGRVGGTPGHGDALLLVALLPVLAAVTSTGLLGSAPLYSSMRMSADVAALAKVTRDAVCPGQPPLRCSSHSKWTAKRTHSALSGPTARAYVLPFESVNCAHQALLSNYQPTTSHHVEIASQPARLYT